MFCERLIIKCLKELSRAINWGQLSGEQLLSNYPGAIIQAPIVRGAIIREAIVLEPNNIYVEQNVSINLKNKT